MRLLFVHGAGGYDDDRPLAEGIARALGAELDLPRLPDEDMSVAGWVSLIRERLDRLGPDGVVAAHSFGGTMLLHALAEAPVAPRAVALLAVPDWGPKGWDVAEYAPAGPEPRISLSLHHCRDDDVVPVDHLALLAARLPSALVREHATGGHQLEGCVGAVAADLVGER